MVFHPEIKRLLSTGYMRTMTLFYKTRRMAKQGKHEHLRNILCNVHLQRRRYLNQSGHGYADWDRWGGP